MKIEEFNAIGGAPELPATLHAAKVERETDSPDNVFRWSINEEMEFRRSIVTSAGNVMTALAAAV